MEMDIKAKLKEVFLLTYDRIVRIFYKMIKLMIMIILYVPQRSIATYNTNHTQVFVALVQLEVILRFSYLYPLF